MTNDLIDAKVIKSNSLIEASYRLSVQEQRIILAAISQARSDTPITDEIMYSVSAQSLAKLTGQDLKNTYHELKEAALRLKRREIRIEKEPDGKAQTSKKVLIIGWVQSIAYLDSEGRIELRFNKDILPYINQLSGYFTLYRLKDVAKMSSAHAIRLYEMIIRWRHSSSKCEIQIQDLKTALQLEKDYPRIYDLKKRVIQPSVDQINEHSDIWLKWDQRKTGRQVTHLTFKFGPKDAHIAEEKPMTKAKFAKFARPGEELKQAVERAKQEGYRFRFDPYAA